MNHKLTILLALITLTSCGDSTVYTNANKTPVVSTSESADAGPATITKDAFLFASPYPARILIPDIDGMRSTAFVVSTLNPAGVVPLDLDKSPIQVSSQFKGVVSPGGTGLPNNLAIENPTRAFMLTSSHIIDFNPTTGTVRSVTAIPKTISLPQAMPLSGPLDFDNDGDTDTTITQVPIAFPGGILITGDTLWVTTGNYLRYAPPAVAAPGIVLRYAITDTGLGAPAITVTSGFNPTGLRSIGKNILITNSGVLNIVGGEAQPQTPSSIDIMDAATGAITATVPADLSALAFFAPAVDATAQFAYYGSSAFSELYQLDIAGKKWNRDLLNPITIGPKNSADYLTAAAITADGKRAYVGSFDQSAIFILDLTASPIVSLPTSYRVGFSKGVSAENPSGINTGVSDIALRPGTSDLFVLTGNPGTLVTISTRPAKAPPDSIAKVDITPLFVAMEVGRQSSASTTFTFQDGRQKFNIRDSVTDPVTGKRLTLRWRSDNPEIASISDTGLITAHASGLATIRVQAGTLTSSATVAVHMGAENVNSGKLVIVNCADEGLTPFVQGVVSTQVGNGGGSGQDKLPGIVSGSPQGAGDYYGNSSDVFSLGAKGQIILAFTHCMITDGPGVDFTVFENAFYAGGNPDAPFSEPAVVGVSMDGITFTDFPCDLAQSPKYPGCAGTHPVYASPENGINPLDPLVSGGDPFDLATLKMPSARFVRIIDQGLSPITGANGTNGFDLDAIAVIHGGVFKP